MKYTKKQRIFAMIGVVILIGMYALTMVFALMKSPAAKALLMASIYCTIAVPVILYGIILISRNARGRRDQKTDPAEQANEENKNRS
jgi:glucose dehydrogenase